MTGDRDPMCNADDAPPHTSPMHPEPHAGRRARCDQLAGHAGPHTCRVCGYKWPTHRITSAERRALAEWRDATAAVVKAADALEASANRIDRLLDAYEHTIQNRD